MHTIGCHGTGLKDPRCRDSLGIEPHIPSWATQPLREMEGPEPHGGESLGVRAEGLWLCQVMMRGWLRGEPSKGGGSARSQLRKGWTLDVPGAQLEMF